MSQISCAGKNNMSPWFIFAETVRRIGKTYCTLIMNEKPERTIHIDIGRFNQFFFYQLCQDLPKSLRSGES